MGGGGEGAGAAGSSSGSGPQATPPMENRLAASYAAGLFVLVPPNEQSEEAPNAAASWRHARLFYMDVKPLPPIPVESGADGTTDASSNRTSAYRELICSTPLPAHSHSLILNSSGSYAAVASINTVYLVSIAPSKLERARMHAAMGAKQEGGIKVQAAPVGSWFHQNNTTLQVLQVSFHPLSDTHLLILTNDSMLRVYSIKHNLDLPVKEFNLSTVVHATPRQTHGSGSGRAIGSVAGSRRNSTSNWLSVSSPPSRSPTSAPITRTKPMATAFSFGAQPATRLAAHSATGSNCAWDVFSIYILFADGSISMVCPYVPAHVSVDRRLIIDLLASEQERMSELEDAIHDAGGIQQVPLSERIEFEQLEARLLWINNTFGNLDTGATTASAEPFIVTRDTSDHEEVEVWMQPAQACGAYVQPATSRNASSSSLVPPPFFSSSSGTNTPLHPPLSGSQLHPYPACHLFALRHAWPLPPGRFFRCFLDGRVDLLLNLQPVQPLFVTQSVHESATMLLETSLESSKEKVCAMFAPGGLLENYSVSTFLLPADMSRLDAVEVPSVIAHGTTTGLGGSPVSSVVMLRAASIRSPSLTRAHSLASSPGVSRMGSALSRAATASSSTLISLTSASPLQPFLPQFRPLIDISDGNSIFFATPRSILHLSYGSQLEEMTAILARGEEDAFVSMQNRIEELECTVDSISALPPAPADRSRPRIVGCTLVHDPLYGRYMVQLTARPGNTVNPFKLDVRCMPQPSTSRNSISIRTVLQTALAKADQSTLAEQDRKLLRGGVGNGIDEVKSPSPSPSPAAPFTGDLSTPDSVTPFSQEVASFLSKYSSFVAPRASFPPPATKGASILSSPEAFGSFLELRKRYMAVYQDLAILAEQMRTRMDLLHTVEKEQMKHFKNLEANVVQARANQAKIQDKLKMHKEMQEQLGSVANSLRSDLQLSQGDLSNAERAFHRELLSLRGEGHPRLVNKVAELQRKTEKVLEAQCENEVAEKAQRRKGMPLEPTTTGAWNERQLKAIKPVLENQSAAVNGLVQQIHDLKKIMTTLRPRSSTQTPTRPLLQQAPILRLTEGDEA